MSTRDMIITPVWQQITDGTQDAKIRVIRGAMYLCEKPPQRDATAKSCLITNWIIVTSPHQTWGRSPWSGTRILVTI